MSGEKSLLRILSCGSVDDGKSTLIGRILYDCGILYEDQLALLEKERTSEGLPDFSCLLDGLLAEREQAITIDVAYRSFRTATRRYLVADAPGHEQYTRNMITGASHADVALLLIDATRADKGLLPQTVRHTAIASLLGIRDIIVAINKMDRVEYKQSAFALIEEEYREKICELPFRSVYCVPVSALHGDNICHKSEATHWYAGPTVLDILENWEPVNATSQPFRMPVQWVARQGDFRGLAGTVVSGELRPGQKLVVQPSGVTATVRSLASFDGNMPMAARDQSVCVQLEEDVDVSRGDILADEDVPLDVADQFAARIVCLSESALVPGRSYIFRHGTSEANATILSLSSCLDLNTLCEAPAKELKQNDIGSIKISLSRPLPFAPYNENQDLGGFLLVDRVSGNTVGAGMLQYALYRSHTIQRHNFTINKAAQATQKNQHPCVFWFTGLSASGKSTLANLAAQELYAAGRHIYTLDGDNLRHRLNRDLGFTMGDRAENIRRAGEVACLLADAGLIVLASFISPNKEERAALRERFESGEFFEIFVDTPLEVCAARDPKGLYAQAVSGKIPNFTGVSAPFDVPDNPDLHLDGTKKPEELLVQLMRFIMTQV
ncbi:MAG: adenylyl-sulfate kinase [Deltaproteobacteria bacterium]|jgi:bifunctional enzyme CysN/CysC|nr:adenylyl-sulfate kinase [Deltaproteobacteria bacterium]